MAKDGGQGKALGALAHAESFHDDTPPPSAVAEEICAAVNAVDDNMAALALSELPQEDNYESDEEEVGGEKKKRGWLGKMSKRLFKGWRAKNNDDETKKMIMACRSVLASTAGGFAIQDPEHARLCRSVLTLMVRQMGKNLLKGANVMNVSFPIQCCQPRTVMEIAATQGGFSHMYLPKAAATKDPVERMKQVVACFVAGMTLTSGNFLKPLNPILGETFQVAYSDGARLYMEQTSHHPPVSSFRFESKDGSYAVYGFLTFTVGFGYNRFYLNNSGIRVVEFADGGKVSFDFPDDRWGNVFWGEMHHESIGSQTFVDESNGLRCKLAFNPEGRKALPSDYFEGVIERYDPADPEKEGTQVSSVEGSWVGFCDFDKTLKLGKVRTIKMCFKVRYWDVRVGEGLTMAVPACGLLPSDSRFRGDRNQLAIKDYKGAQEEKLRLEEKQRADRKLREAAARQRGASVRH